MTGQSTLPVRLTRTEVAATAGYIARLLLRTVPERRTLVLRQWSVEQPPQQEAEVVAAVVVRLTEIVDACGDLSPRAREWVRDEVAKVADPFKTAAS